MQDSVKIIVIMDKLQFQMFVQIVLLNVAENVIQT
jgi:hypothetical protein